MADRARGVRGRVRAAARPILRPVSGICGKWWRRRPWWCPSPAPASPPNAAFPTSGRPAASGPRCGRSSSGDFLASQEMRDESWRRRFAMEEQFGGAKPGRGHRALASLYKAGKVPGIITQNIDNLHQASGFAAEDVVELHGNTTYATCLDCGKALRIVVGEAKLRPKRRSFAGMHRLRRLHQDRDGLVRPVDAGGGDAARPGTDRVRAICSSPSARRWWFGRRRAFRWPPSATARGLSSSTGTRPSSTKSPISCVHDDIGAALAPFIAH